MQSVTAAVTPKGERRRYALVSAAADLLCEGGFDAVRHRAVARRAGLPLASTTYYFSSLDDLVERAVEHVGIREAETLDTRVAALSRRKRGAESTADVLVDLLVGDGPGTRVSEQLISRYERYIACARQPGLRDVQRRIMKQRTEAVVEVVERSGRSVRAELMTALVCAVDGAVVASLVGVGDGPRAAARATLVDVIDVLAPFDSSRPSLVVPATGYRWNERHRCPRRCSRPFRPARLLQDRVERPQALVAGRPARASMAGKRVVVTGATAGLGEAMAKSFAGLGATVHLLGRNPDKVRRSAGLIRGAVPGSVVIDEVCDVGDLDAVRAWTDDLSGRVDALQAWCTTRA